MVGAGRVQVEQSPYINGYFGGLKKGGTIFKLLLSRNGGVTFYRVNPLKVGSYRNIPLNAPIKILVDKGFITSVEVLEGQR
jgi:hypothetical protein